MAFVAGTAGLWFRSVLLVAALALPAEVAAQVSPEDRQDIVRLAGLRGATEADVAPLLQEIDQAAERGLPQSALLNKAKEGLSKGHPPARVHAVVRDIAGHLDTAREVIGSVADSTAGTRAMGLVARALAGGVTRAEVTRLRQLIDDGGPPADAERLALGVRFWAHLREAGLPPRETLPLVAETIRQNYRAADLTRLAREMTARGAELATPARIEALHQAIARGERVERLLPPRDRQRGVNRARPEVRRPADREPPQRERPGRPR